METNKKTQILEEILQKTREQKEKIESTKITNWILVAWLLFALIMAFLPYLKNQQIQESFELAEKYVFLLFLCISFMLANSWYKKHLLSKKGEITLLLNLVKQNIKFGLPVAPKKKKLQNYEELMHQIAWDRYLDDERHLTYLILSLIGWRSDIPKKFLSETESLSEKEREEYYKQIDELYEYFSKL